MQGKIIYLIFLCLCNTKLLTGLAKLALSFLKHRTQADISSFQILVFPYVNGRKWHLTDWHISQGTAMVRTQMKSCMWKCFINCNTLHIIKTLSWNIDTNTLPFLLYKDAVKRKKVTHIKHWGLGKKNVYVKGIIIFVALWLIILQ